MDRMRSLLLVSPLDEGEIAAAEQSSADALVIDVDRPVRQDQLDAAREAAARLVTRWGGQRAVWLRVHPTTTLLAKDDVQAAAAEGLRGIVLPAAQSVQHLRYVEALLRDAEETVGLKDGSLRMVAEISTAEGLSHVRELVRGSGRLAAVALDGDGFCADMGLEHTRDERLLQYPRAQLALAARAAAVLSLDGAFTVSLDEAALMADVVAAHVLGMTGKFAASTGQVAAINGVFMPTVPQLDAARRLVDAAKAAEEAGNEAVLLDGRVVPGPAVERARRLLALADESTPEPS